MLGAAAVGVFGFIYFAMLNTGSLPVIFLAIVLSLIPHDMMYGPAGLRSDRLKRSFTGRLHFATAPRASLGLSKLASVIAGVARRRC